MLFISHVFVFLFLPLTVIAYVWGGRRFGRTGAVVALTAASLVFYSYWKIVYLPLLVGSVVVNYGLGTTLRRLHQQAAPTRTLRLVLAGGVVFNLALLGYYKYANFFVEAINDVTGTHWRLAPIFLPLAISFFTFQQIAFIVDAYRGQTERYSFLQYMLFVTFFPQLIAGPIVKHDETLAQVKDEKFFKFSHENLAVGLTMFVFGLFKKVVIADYIATFANPVFDLARDGQPLYFFEAWGGALAYTFQLYFDFSGYSEMAIGLGRMFGIKLPLNFRSPFRSRSIPEIWRNWHITLHRFLRDYLYIPLGGNRKGWLRRVNNVMVTMLIGGIWHGAGWTFVIFGGLHSIYMLITFLWRDLLSLMGWPANQAGRPRQWAARILTFIAFTVGLMIFRADHLEAAFGMLVAMGGVNGFIPPELTFEELAMLRLSNRHAFEMSGYLWVFLLLAMCWFWPNGYQIMRDHQPGLPETVQAPPRPLSRLRWRPDLSWALIILTMAVFAVLKSNSESEFLYFQF